MLRKANPLYGAMYRKILERLLIITLLIQNERFGLLHKLNEKHWIILQTRVVFWRNILQLLFQCRFNIETIDKFMDQFFINGFIGTSQCQ